jgi:hypothetical protein
LRIFINDSISQGFSIVSPNHIHPSHRFFVVKSKRDFEKWTFLKMSKNGGVGSGPAKNPTRPYFFFMVWRFSNIRIFCDDNFSPFFSQGRMETGANRFIPKP